MQKFGTTFLLAIVIALTSFAYGVAERKPIKVMCSTSSPDPISFRGTIE